MDDEELESFLDDQRTLYFATVSENGWPHVAPVGFARLDDGHFYVLTHPKQRKSRNFFHDNRVGLTVDDGETYTDSGASSSTVTPPSSTTPRNGRN